MGAEGIYRGALGKLQEHMGNCRTIGEITGAYGKLQDHR